MATKAPAAPRGKIVSRGGLAEIFGVSLPTVDEWVRQGCPIVKKGSRGIPSEFASADVSDWLATRAARDAGGDDTDELDQIEKRTKRAKMLEAELSLAKARGDVAPVAEFEKATSALMAQIRQNMLNIPQRVVVQLIGMTDETAFKRILRGEIVTALESASAAELDLGDEDDEVDGDA